MTCKSCRKKFEKEQPKCPHCGEANPEVSGIFQTSVVLISVGGADLVYRSIDEVPAPLRTRLLRSTNSSNSATILIADRRGRTEAAKAMRNGVTPMQRRLMNSLLKVEEAAMAGWLTPGRKRGIVVAIVVLTLALIGFLFGHHFTLPELR
jgi:hypothetical protein